MVVFRVRLDHAAWEIMKRLRLPKPTHELCLNGQRFALLSLRGDNTGVKLLSTGHVSRSVSVVLASHLREGRWQGPLTYLFGEDANHIPHTAQVIPLEKPSS